jgi:hypothetical protein
MYPLLKPLFSNEGNFNGKYINVFSFFKLILLPFDCFRDGSGLNALRIKMRSGAAILI